MLTRATKTKWKRTLRAEAIAFFLSATFLSVTLVSQSAWSADGPGNAESGDNGTVTAASAPGKTETSVSEDEFEQLKELIQSQSNELQQLSRELKEEQAKTQALEDRLSTTNTGGTVVGALPVTGLAAIGLPVVGVPPSASGPAPAQTPAQAPTSAQSAQAQTSQDLSNRIGNLEDQLKNFGPFSFTGDIRLRDEPFFGGPANQSLDQNRERFRFRFNVVAKLNDDFSGGFSLASGDLNDPTSTNQTVTGFYTRKAIALDKAFIDYSPHTLRYVTLIGGKFAYPWYNTELTWDKDLNPEGVAQVVAFNADTPLLKKVALVGFELPFSQVAGVSVNNQSLVASIVYGGQLQTIWQFTKRVKFGAYSGFYNYHNADPIAVALAKASAKNPQTPLTGLLPLGTGNTVQNSIVTTTSTNEVTVNGTSYPTGVTTVTNAQFSSKFGLFDSIGRFDISTPSDRWPVALIGDYVQNTEACANVDHILAAPANTTSLHYTQSTNFACNSNQRRGYWGEVQVGRGQQRGDWQFDYTRMFIEREAVLSNFDYSDIRQGSNVTQHRAIVFYQVHRNVQLSATALIGRPLNFGGTAPPENWLKRYQFDIIYTF